MRQHSGKLLLQRRRKKRRSPNVTSPFRTRCFKPGVGSGGAQRVVGYTCPSLEVGARRMAVHIPRPFFAVPNARIAVAVAEHLAIRQQAVMASRDGNGKIGRTSSDRQSGCSASIKTHQSGLRVQRTNARHCKMLAAAAAGLTAEDFPARLL